MLLTHLQDRFVCLCSFAEKDVAKSAGFRWNPARREWWTADAVLAKQLEHLADGLARAALGRATGTQDASRAETADIVVPAPPGLSYRPYQRAGIAYMLEHKRCLNADEPGLGKTIQAIGLVNVLPPRETSRVLIICPATLRLNWQSEWKRWCARDIRVAVVTDTWWKGIDPDGDMFSPAMAVILSYEGVKKHKAKIDAIKWDLLIVDEAHALKEKKTQRSRAILGYYANVPNHPKHLPAIKAERMIFMTGTPIVNRPGELWPLAHAIDPDGLGRDEALFRQRYVTEPVPPPTVHAKGVWIDQHKRVRMAELHDRLRQRFMVRRRKSDVLKELPAKQRQIVLLDIANAGQLIAAEKRALAGLADQQEQLRREISALPHVEAVQKLRRWRGAAMTEISRIRHETAVAKIPACIDHMFALLDEHEKIIMFAHHHDVVDALVSALPGASVQLDGRQSDVDRDQSVRRFQSERGVRVFVGSIRAAGVGLTLTASAVVCFAELDWTPSGMVQAEDRAHRLGQQSSVLVQHLVLDGSIDQRMSKILVDKAEVIGQIIDGEAVQAQAGEMLDALLRR